MEAAIVITDGASVIISNDETKKNKFISGTVLETAEKQDWLYLLSVSFFHMIHYRYARKNTEYIERQ